MEEKKKRNRTAVPAVIRKQCWDCIYRGSVTKMDNGVKKTKPYCKSLMKPCELAYLECEYRE